MTGLLADVHFGLRRLLREPGFAGASILTIGLGVGSAAAIFTIVNAVLLRPLAVPQPERVMVVHRLSGHEADLSQPDTIDIRRQSKSFAGFAAVADGWSLDTVIGREPLHLTGGLVEPEYFRVAGLNPLAGRLLRQSDDAAGAAPVVVLGESFWRRRFSADPGVIGSTLMVSGVPATVVGIAPDRADILHGGVDVWVPVAPFAAWAREARGSNVFEAVARLAPGVPVETARQELEALTRRMAKEYPRTNGSKILSITPARDFLVGNVQRGLWVLLGGVLLVVMISTANVASLMLVRAAGRVREMGVRHALGAGRGRLARQLVIEGLLVSLTGGAAGAAVAWLGFGALKRFIPESLPRIEETSPDWRVLLFALALCLLTGVLFSLAPMWRLLGRDRLSVAGSARGLVRGGDRRVLGPLVAGEIAIAAVLLCGALLLLRSFSNLLGVPLGFEPKGVAMANVVLPDSRYSDPAKQTAAFTAIVESMRRTAGVVDAAFVVGAPQTSATIGHLLVVDGRVPAPDERPAAAYQPFIGNVVRTLGLRIVKGRDIPLAEQQGKFRVAMVNETFVRQYLAGRDPVGARIAWKAGDDEPAWMTIVGVVGDVKPAGLRDSDAPAVYAPYLQRDDDWIRFGTLIARVEGDPATWQTAMQKAVSSFDPLVPIDSFTSLPDRVDKVLAGDRFSLQLLTLFGVIALGLSVQGIFAVVAYDVEQRRGELGLRMALGAASVDVLRLVMRRGALYTLTGILLGTAGSLALTRLLDSLLFETSSRDPLALAAALAVLGITCLTAVMLPAFKASRMQPSSVLQEQ